MEDSRGESSPDGVTSTDNTDERQRDFTRRALLRAGWVVPLVTTVNIPSAFAQSPVPPGHADHDDHTDVPHSDVQPHVDTVHGDTPHTDHADEPHLDHQDHQDVHADAHSDSHIDIHTDVHTDVPNPHTDVPHVDTNVLR